MALQARMRKVCTCALPVRGLYHAFETAESKEKTNSVQMETIVNIDLMYKITIFSERHAE